MLLVAGAMWRERAEPAPAATCRPGRCALIGAAIGILTGFLGIGGGFLIVPSLVMFAGLSVRKAIGTSLAIIALNSLAGLGGQARYVHFDWGVTLAFVGAASVGMLVGVGLGGRLTERALRRSLACFLVLVALILAWENALALI